MKQNERSTNSELQYRSSQRELEVGRYSDQQYTAVGISEQQDTEVFLKSKQSESVEFISGQLQKLYSDINQHVNQKLSDIDQKNQEIGELVVNLNVQVRNVLSK